MAKLELVWSLFIVVAYLSATAYRLDDGMVGGKTKVKNVESNEEIQDLGRYLVYQFNMQQQRKSVDGGSLTFKKVADVEMPVVSGIKYYLKIATSTSSGAQKLFDAEVVAKRRGSSPRISSASLLRILIK